MRVEIGRGAAVFLDGASVAGVYVLDDPLKPHFSVLNTPKGNNTTLAMPVDHRHHKGLMFALKCDDLNFWEETPGGPACGAQQIVRTEPAGGNGLRQELLWRRENGALETYRETREISCVRRSDGRAFVWTWRTRRESLRAHRLVKSEWSTKMPDGRAINYHGLGIRLPWAWAFPADRICGVEAGGVAVKPEAATGTAGPSMGFHGLFDGKWAPDRGGVIMAQAHGFGWYVLKGSFAYLSTGPTVLEEMDVARGRTFDETYTVTVEDREEQK